MTMTKQEIYSMNKAQLIMYRNNYQEKINLINERLERMTKTLKLKDSEAPFRKWSLNEMNSLYEINSKAFEWFSNHKDMSVSDYNQQAYEEDRVNLE